jgi:tetratricopeptide (TPR) repeat protein
VQSFVQGQGISQASLRSGLESLDNNRALGATEKLQLLYEWKAKAEVSKLPFDSVYARLLHRIGVYEFYTGKRYNTALILTMQAMLINTSGKAGSSPSAAATDLFNIAYYYDRLTLFKRALVYYDSAILFARRGPDIDNVVPDSWLGKAYIYFRMGDYEKALEESERARTLAVRTGDSLHYLIALNQRAQALFMEGKLSAAREDTRDAISLAQSLHHENELASALKLQGLIFTQQHELSKAEASFTGCIAARIGLKLFSQVASDYNDLGNFYGDTLHAFSKALTCFSLAIRYARMEGDSARMAMTSLNLGRNYYNRGEIKKAITSYLQAMDYFKIGTGGEFTRNPSATELSAIGNKELIQTLFNSKTALLLDLYRRTHDRKFLTACLRTALLNDSLIRDIRHEQLGEQSKLYWRGQTRGFFVDALEASFLAQDDRLAFYFMEESRSVLLQDKLNELGAHAYLPPAEAATEEMLRINIVELQQLRSTLPDTSARARIALQDLLTAKESLEVFIKSLEKNYPAYYQYKYANDVRTLSSLQEYLLKNNQCFVDYFIEDTLCFALCIQPSSTQFVRIVKKNPAIEDQLRGMVRFCADENALTRDFPGFLASSHSLYRLLWTPFQLPAGRVIICQDNYLIPFEALTADPVKADFLVRKYSFSYVYSARYLLNQHEQGPGKGDFLGIAPVSFTAYNGLADLKLSEDALLNCSAPYRNRKLLVHTDANRQNFMSQVCNYNTTTILTHATADSSDNEPLLFMNDSVIRLSELQMLNKPAARLIILSACQTNVGKYRNGEGIFSLARGFSAAGIPSVAATQWMADEAAIYSISQKFNENIFRGMNKDEALQKAKLFYMFEDKKGSQLPCYWADMILIGNTDPVRFSGGSKWGWLLPALALGLFLIGCGFYWVRLARRKPGPTV